MPVETPEIDKGEDKNIGSEKFNPNATPNIMVINNMQTQEPVVLEGVSGDSPQGFHLENTAQKRLTTTGAKTQLANQDNEKIVEIDDIQCDLDEEIDDEHYNGAAANQGGAMNDSETKGQRVSNINDSFISQRMRDFSNVSRINGNIPHVTSTKLQPLNKPNHSFLNQLPPITPSGNQVPNKTPISRNVAATNGHHSMHPISNSFVYGNRTSVNKAHLTFENQLNKSTTALIDEEEKAADTSFPVII